jgi:hypothetical protein
MKTFFRLKSSNGVSKNLSFHTDFKNVHMTSVKSAPKQSFNQKTILLKICPSPKKSVSWAKQATTQYFGKRFFYKQALEFHCPSKFLCQTSGHQNHWSLLYSVQYRYTCGRNPCCEWRRGRGRPLLCRSAPTSPAHRSSTSGSPGLHLTQTHMLYSVQ